MSHTTIPDGAGHRDDAPVRQDRASEPRQAGVLGFFVAPTMAALAALAADYSIESNETLPTRQTPASLRWPRQDGHATRRRVLTVV